MRAPRLLHGALAAFALLLLHGRPAAAQFDIYFSDPIQFPQPGATHFLAGQIDQGGTQVRVVAKNSSRAWRLYLRAKDASLGGANGYLKPISDVLWRVEGSSTWQALSTTNALVHTGVGDQTVTVYFRMLLAWSRDAPDSSTNPFSYEAAVAWRAEH